MKVPARLFIGAAVLSLGVFAWLSADSTETALAGLPSVQGCGDFRGSTITEDTKSTVGLAPNSGDAGSSFKVTIRGAQADANGPQEVHILWEWDHTSPPDGSETVIGNGTIPADTGNTVVDAVVRANATLGQYTVTACWLLSSTETWYYADRAFNVTGPTADAGANAAAHADANADFASDSDTSAAADSAAHADGTADRAANSGPYSNAWAPADPDSHTDAGANDRANRHPRRDVRPAASAANDAGGCPHASAGRRHLTRDSDGYAYSDARAIFHGSANPRARTGHAEAQRLTDATASGDAGCRHEWDKRRRPAPEDLSGCAQRDRRFERCICARDERCPGGDQPAAPCRDSRALQ